MVWNLLAAVMFACSAVSALVAARSLREALQGQETWHLAVTAFLIGTLFWKGFYKARARATSAPPKSRADATAEPGQTRPAARS
jgi:hypothetical protein